MKFKNWLLIIGSLFPISASAQLDNLPQVFAPLDIAHLNEYYPESHNQWFPTGINQQESARQRYLYMAPLGVRGLAHVPEYMSNAACKAITHPAFRISDGTIEVPYYEVQAVDDRGPATNLLTAGDLIVGVGGTPLKSGTQYNPEIEYYTKRNRTLFDCLGDAIDKAEGTGSITFQVMRLPEGLSASTTIPNRNIEVHRTDLVDDHQDRAIEVNVGNAAQLRLIAEDAADGNGGDHAYWLEARWVKDDGAEVHVVNNEWIDSQVGYGSLTWGDSVTYSGGTTTNSIAAHAHSEILFNVPSGVTKLRVTFRNHSTGSVVGVVKTTATAVNYGDLAQYITDVTIPVSKIGSYLAGGAEREHKLDQMIVSQAAWLLSEQRADGGWSSLGSYTTDVWDTSYIGLAMLAADEPRFDESAKKAAYYIADRGQVTDWSSPRGIALTFLCEYYLRTGDTGILPGIEVALKMVEQNLFAQGYTGHKTLYGYGTGGQNSGFSYMAMGVALASRTPVEVDQNLLNKMMELMDAMAVNGVIGYGRLTTEGYNADQGVVDGVAMTGPCVAANSITGTSQRFHDRAKSAFAKSVGALDFGHSTQSFGLFGGTIGAINLGDEIYQGHRDRIMPKMILQRLYSGGVVTSECRLEMMGAEYMFRHRMATAIQLLTLSAGRKNLAITGKAALQASTMKSGRNTHVWDMATHRFYLRGWAVAITLLGDQAPARLRSGYEALKNVSYDGALNSLHNDIYTILEANALNAVSDINALTGVSDEIKAQAIEMLLGVDLHIQVTEKASDLADVSLSAYWPLRERNRWSDSATQEAWKTNASYIMSGNISIAKGSSISADVNMAFNSSTASTNWTDGHASSLGSAEVTRLNTATEFNLPVQITYSIGGNAISYTRNVTFETALGGGHDDARHVTIPSCRVLRKTKGDELVVELNETGEYLQMHGPLATEFHQGETVQVEFKQMELSLGGHRAATKVADGLTRYRAVSFTGSPDCLVTQPDINSLVDTDLSTGGVSRALSGQIWAGFEMDLGEIKHFNGIQINKPSGGFQVFKVEAELNGEWVRILEKGWVTGTDYFDTINAQKLRVYWKANGSGYTPTINDIQVFFNPYSDKETKVALSPNGGVFTQWKLWREKYTNLSTGSIAALKANANFPNSPSSSGPLLALETGDDVDDNYGQRWTGWITPDETGNYIFYAAADDEVELHLSTDEHPNNKVLIASKYGWTPARNWSTGAISSQISLVAGKRYYIELLHTQAYGGDNCAIAWRKPSDTAAPANGSIGITDSYFETVVGGVSATANYVFPSITSQPSAVVATAGQPASLTVVAGGSGTLTYQWMKDGVVLTNGVSPTYNIASAAAGDLGSYTCLIRNEYGQVLTQAASLSFTNSSPQAVDATFVQAENVAAGAVVGSVNATDPDSGTSFSYAITAGNTNGAFSISSTGQITTAASLDFEYIDKYVLAVQVSDNGTPALSDTALITVNVSNVHDQAPTLANMQTTINDGEVVGEWVIQMSAIDQDVVNGDTLTYSITGGNTGGAFSIDSNTGRVSTATTLDSTVTPSYSLIITVTDSVGLTDTGTLTVAVTESKHSILAALWKFDSTVPVTGGVKDVIGDVAGKFEGGAVLSNDAQGRTGVAGDKALNLGSGNGCVDVADVVFLQRLSADDMMTISFWQKVNTAGLDSSSFYAYSPSSSGNMRGIQAHTPWSNGRIYLDIRGNGSANRMDVAEPSGINWTQWCHVAFVKKGGTAEIWVNGAKLGDSSGKSALATDYTKLILGADSITSGSVNGYLDDFAFFKTALDASQISALASGVTPLLISPPVINDVTFSVNENVAIGASVDIVTATDPDADDTKVYSITGGNTGNAFTINSASGALTTAALLNHEEIGSYTLTIKVTDSAGLSDTATVTVDVADLDESSFTGVQAWEDNVQNRSEFHSKRSAVLAGNTTTTVDLTGISGDATFEFIVDAEDLAQTDLSILEGNGWSLRFEQWNNLNQLGVTRIGLTDFTLTAQAGQTVASPYGSVHQLVYVVDSVNNVTRVYLDSVLVGTLSQQPNFAASSITLGNANLRDDANAGLHAFAAYNSALGAADIAGLKNAWFGVAPVASDATFSIAQSSASGSAVGTVSATDPGDTLSYAITAGNTGNVFEINSSTGAITTSVALNSAIEISYTLTVAVTDNGGLVDTATITVNVSNYQSWATHYELTVAEAALSADPNGDGKPNSFHYAFDTNPKSLTSDTQKLRTTVSEISGSDYLTITLPVRVGATFSGAPLTSAAIDGITYTIEADADMVSPWNLRVVEVTPALDSGLPVLSDRDGNGAADWVYRSFRVGGNLGANNKAFIRASVGVVE